MHGCAAWDMENPLLYVVCMLECYVAESHLLHGRVLNTRVEELLFSVRDNVIAFVLS